MTQKTRKDAMEMIMAGADEMAKAAKSAWRRGLLTGDEQEERLNEIAKAMKEALLAIA